jgi:hypothetical protein
MLSPLSQSSPSARVGRGPTDHGHLRFLFTQPCAGSADRTLITAFCAHAAIAPDRAALLVQVDNLQVALTSNRIIGAAVGVLMARHGVAYPDGMSQLKTASQNANRRLLDVANDVLCTGQLPVTPSPVARPRRPCVVAP